MKAKAKTKYTVAICLRDSAMEKIRLLVDDEDTSAKTRWDELQWKFSVSSTQALANILAELEKFKFVQGENWDNHVSEFMSLIDEPARLDQNITAKYKVTKTIRPRPKTFDAIYRAST